MRKVDQITSLNKKTLEQKSIDRKSEADDTEFAEEVTDHDDMEARIKLMIQQQRI